jgi:hypothetical protein
MWTSPSSAGSGSLAFSGIFIAGEADGLGDTMVDVQTPLKAFLNMSLRFACFTDRTRLAFHGKKKNFWSWDYLYSSAQLSQFLNYHISQPIRRTFFPEKCDLNSSSVLCAEGKYYFQT